MRKLAISLFLLALTTTFSQMPAMAAPAGSASGAAVVAPLGVVMQANHAQVSSDTAANGATVFNGDTLLTDESGTLQVRFGSSQAYLLPRTSATVNETAGGFAATLNGGTVILSSANGEVFRLLADGATIRPSTTQATMAQITLVNSRELELISRKGALEISMDGDVKTMPEGSSMRMVIQTPEAANGAGPTPQGNGSGANPSGSNKFLLFALALVGVGVGIGIWQALVSPSKP